MASPPSSTQSLGDRSHLKPTVTLYDWWLVKSKENDGKSRLAVAGVSSAPEEIPRRVFNSAPISKKHDVFTLETTDGVTIILDGIINKQQTIANGFSDEIAKRFQLGFYPGWEKGVAELLTGDSNTTGVSGKISDLGSEGEGKKNSSPTSVHFSQEETRSAYEHVGSTYFQWNGRSKNLEGNQKNPMSGCSMKHKSTKSLPSLDAFENVGETSGAAALSGGKMSDAKRCPSNSARRVTRFLSDFWSKWTNQKLVGNGLTSEKKTTDSDLKVSKTVNNSVQTDECEVGEKGTDHLSQNTVNCVPAVESVSNTSQNVDYEVGGRQLFESFLSCCERVEGIINCSPTSVHVAHENPNEKVHCEDRLDAEEPIQITTNLSSDSIIDDSKVDDLLNHAAEVELDAENIGLTGFQSFGRPQTREENEKNPTSEPTNESLEILDEVLDANAQSGEKIDISVGSPSQFAGKVSVLFSGIIRRKAKKKQTVGNGLNSETNTIDFVPAVSGSVTNPLSNDRFETAGIGMSHPSDSELLEPVDVNVVRKLDFDFVEDDMQQTSKAKEGQDFGNVTAQVGEGKSGVKEKNTSRKRNMRQVLVDAQEIHPIPKVNKKKNRTPSTAEVRKKKNGTPEVNKKRKASPSTSEASKKKRLTPLTPVNSKKEASISTPKLTAHRSIISPESLSAGRSRSGRLRLPPLEFWRNQSAVYDKDHGVIGIQEELARATPLKGSLSEPRKRKGNRG